MLKKYPIFRHVLLMVSLFSSSSSLMAQRAPTVVFTEQVKIMDLYNISIYGGRIEPYRLFPQPSEIAGIIRAISVKPGDRVVVGQPLYTVQQVVVAQNYQPTLIRALNSGTVVQLNSGVGERINAGTSVVTIADNSAYRVRFFVGEQDINRIRLGDVVYLSSFLDRSTALIEEWQTEARRESTTDERRERLQQLMTEERAGQSRWQGRIALLPLVPNYTTGLFELEATFQATAELQLGYFERIQLRVNPYRGLAVSQTYITRRFGQDHVTIVNEESKITFIPVVTGNTYGDQVSILEGLKEGQPIVVGAGGRYQQGDVVTAEQRGNAGSGR